MSVEGPQYSLRCISMPQSTNSALPSRPLSIVFGAYFDCIAQAQAINFQSGLNEVPQASCSLIMQTMNVWIFSIAASGAQTLESDDDEFADVRQSSCPKDQ